MEALLPLLQDRDFAGHLQLFVNKFKGFHFGRNFFIYFLIFQDRVCEMVLDKDIEVAVKAVQSATAIYRYVSIWLFVFLFQSALVM